MSGHWDDTLLIGSNHNVRTAVCLGTGITSSFVIPVLATWMTGEGIRTTPS
ncbi:MAG: hypothetical protein O7198_00070 [Wolbachia endosymbiont of Nomada marshamella]|nr:hypothetical protein [Wolbachia endosymbiont of Nomada marshamella]